MNSMTGLSKPLGFAVVVVGHMNYRGSRRVSVEYVTGPTLTRDGHKQYSVGNFINLYRTYGDAEQAIGEFRRVFGRFKRYAGATIDISAVVRRQAWPQPKRARRVITPGGKDAVSFPRLASGA